MRRWPALGALAAAQKALAGTTVLRWLAEMSGDNRAFPLMDFVTSDSEEIDLLIDQIDGSLAPCDEEAPALAHIAEAVRERGGSLLVDERGEAHLAEWLLQLNWLGLTLSGALGRQIISDLANLFGPDSALGGASCDEADSEQDFEYVQRIHRSLGGVETLPLESNEFKWVDFFVRHRYGSAFCALGVASLFLVAGDVTAYASAAAGGEHMRRLRRAVLFAQGIARDRLLDPGEPGTPGDLLRTRWPIWRLLASIQAELIAGQAAVPQVARPHVPASLPGAMLPADDSELYLSVIVQGRNDDYGENMMVRFNRMLITATHMLHKLGIPSEIIVVDWNPPFGLEPLSELLERAPGTKETVPIRVIRVPTEVHMSLPHHKAHPIFEHIAENVAFRRARGKFVLKTNIDNIMSMDMAMFLARGELREDAVYRATYAELDFTSEADGLEPDALLDWVFSQPRILQDMNYELVDLNAKYPEDTKVCSGEGGGGRSGDAIRPFYWAGSGDFVLTSRALVRHVRGYPQIAQNWQTDDLIHCRLRAVGVRQIVLQPPCVTVHQNHRRINRVRSSTRWVVTDSNFQDVCSSPFAPLPTQTGLGDDWGFASIAFEEAVV